MYEVCVLCSFCTAFVTGVKNNFYELHKYVLRRLLLNNNSNEGKKKSLIR